jgi:hypothetical protein
MRIGPAWAPNTPWLASIWHKGKVFPCSDILQFNETVIAHGLQLSEEWFRKVPAQGMGAGIYPRF